jgi:hypothetical protein
MQDSERCHVSMKTEQTPQIAVSMRCPVYQKGNQYLADWRDRKGTRKRKSFTTPEEAPAYEQAEKGTARPKARLAAAKQSPMPSAVSRGANTSGATHSGPRAESSPSADRSRRANSTSGTSTRSAEKSSRANRHPPEAAGPERRGGSSATSRRNTAAAISRHSSRSRRHRANAT